MTGGQQEVFFEVHSGLPERPRILDLGCGPGAQTLELAGLCQGRIVAVDNHEPFLEQLRPRAAQLGLADRVEARLGDMGSLPFEPGSFDLIWPRARSTWSASPRGCPPGGLCCRWEAISR